MPIRAPEGYLDITNATLRASEIVTTSNVGIANANPTNTLSIGSNVFFEDTSSNTMTVRGNVVTEGIKLGFLQLLPSYDLELTANVGNSISNTVQFTNSTTGFITSSNVGIGTNAPDGLVDVGTVFKVKFGNLGATAADIITGYNSVSITESGGTYTYTRDTAANYGNFLPSTESYSPITGRRYRIKLTARSDYTGSIRLENPANGTVIASYDLTTTFTPYEWEFTATATTMYFRATITTGTTLQFNAFSMEVLEATANTDVIMGGTRFIKAHDASKNYVAIGPNAGATAQGSNATAVGYLAGQSNQGNQAVAVGLNAGQTSQGINATAVGYAAGQTSQGGSAVAVGVSAGQTSQGSYAVAVGLNAGRTSQGDDTTAVGRGAGQFNQGSSAIAVGYQAGLTSQGNYATAVGVIAGQENQGNSTVAVGNAAGNTDQGNFAVAVGNVAGQTSQGGSAVAVGVSAGQFNQGIAAIAVGYQAGQSNQVNYAVAMGRDAGRYNQRSYAVAVGTFAGETSQGTLATAVGNNAGRYNQSSYATAVGNTAGYSNQGNNAVAVGNQAARNNQGSYAIAVGYQAGSNNQHANSIVLNASGAALNTGAASSFYVKPVRGGNFAASALAYTSAGEVVEETNVHFDTNGNVGIGTASPKTNFGTPAFEVYNGVIMSGERTTATDPNYSLYVGKGTGSGWLTGYTATGGHVFAFYNTSPSNGGWNYTSSSFYISKETNTNRSINAAGSINASGNDYAEYIRKKDLDMVINKGDIVGIDSNAYLTNVFSESVTFAVKSTDPALIGGDTWGVDLDMYAPIKPTELNSDASEEEINNYNLELQNYETEKLIWEEQHENARKPYDRIAFCGQVPVNVYNATPGQYVIPKRTDDDTISYELTNTPTFEQYQISIGKVIKIQEDGRAWIVVKIS